MAKNNTLIKVCGMKEGRNIKAIENLGVDLIGFIFYSKSPRFVCETPSYLPLKAKRVGVFVNEDQEYIQLIANRFSLDYIQLHGNESPEYCIALKNKGVKIIKNFSIAQKEDLEQIENFEGICDYFLFDTKCESYGGSGEQFDWNVLYNYHGKTPFLLSGGINLQSVKALQDFNHPRLAGYDINSCFETKPGNKDVRKTAKFVKQITI